MLDRLFNWGKKRDAASATADPRIDFGRYSDNNKTLKKIDSWTSADNLFKEKKYRESVDAFFEYLKDDEKQNVTYSRNGDSATFEIYQGSKIVRGSLDNNQVSAEVRLARMAQPSVPVMRRMLEMNFSLYYSRYALDNDALCMRFDTQLEAANPSKLYYGLKELATKSDKQDDLFVQDFTQLEALDNEHIIGIPDPEKQARYDAMQNWITETLDKVGAVDADKFSGGIAYLLLALVYRIDFLITPEGQTLNDLEKISNIYFKKDERPAVEKNRDMTDAFRKLKDKPREEIYKDLFRSKYTFSIVTPQVHKSLADAIHESNDNMLWYRDNGHPYFANKIIEYGLTYCQFTYSLPKPVTQLIQLFMQVNYPGFFTSLGFNEVLYNETDNSFEQEKIVQRIKQIQGQWKSKYPYMDFKIASLSFINLIQFNQSFTQQVELLNMDGPK